MSTKRRKQVENKEKDSVVKSDPRDQSIAEEDKKIQKDGFLDSFLPRFVTDAIYEKAWAPTPASSLVFFRIVWGLIMAYESSTYMTRNWSKLEYILKLPIQFKYYGFEWVTPWPGYGMHIHVALMGVFALMITFGFLYRLSAAIFFMMFAYLYLQEMTLYLNHFYLVCIISFLFIFLDAACCWSVDAWLWPKSRRTWVPYWNIWIIRTLVSVVYVYAGIAKMNEDWIRGEPLLHWLPKRRKYPIIGYFMEQPWVALLFSWCGLLLDTFLPFALEVKILRPFAFLACCGFHLMNKVIFNIGIFPWMMLASTTIHFETGWIEHAATVITGKKFETDLPKLPKVRRLNLKQAMTIIFICAFMSHQIITPLRHLWYPGDVVWTEEGHRWSWRMKLRDKAAAFKFWVRDLKQPGNRTLIENDRLLSKHQQRKVSCRPELLILYAHYIKEMVERQTGRTPEVTAEVVCSVNFRPPQHMIVPGYDLAKAKPWEWPNEWVIPLVPLGDNSSKWLVDPKKYSLLAE